MFRPALLAGAAALVFATAHPALSDTVFYCVPDEQRATAPDRLVSVEVTIKPNGDFASVVYKAANGATYSRGQQYEATSRQDGTEHFWMGTLRTNRNIAMVGAFHRVGGRLVYYETIHDKLQTDKIVAHVASICDGGHPIVAESPPQTTPSVPSSPGSFPDREFKVFLDCIDAAAVTLATISSEPAQTIVDAAIGECPHERFALEKAIERQGTPKPFEIVDELAKETRPNLLALVLNARAAVARPSGAPAKSEPAKGEAL
jgi:hypothetical protein